MFNSTPEHLQAAIDERERETQLILRATAVKRMMQDDRARTSMRPWPQIIARMPRSLRV